jgi:hypothetical protein
MTQSDATDHRNMKEAKLPRRDWILLPLISLLTICFIAVSTELIARRVFPRSKKSIYKCMTNPDDPSLGLRAIPNSVCWEQTPESQLTEYRFNSCGHRAGMECGPKHPGTYRIVMVGQSVAMGTRVQREQTFAALLPTQLSQRTGRKIELYNEALLSETPHVVDLRFNEVLAAKPDLILWVLGNFDVETETTEFLWRNPAGKGGTLLAKAWFRVKFALTGRSYRNAVRYISQRALSALNYFTTLTLIQHFLIESQSLYLKSFLRGGDRSGYLLAEPGAAWQSRLRRFDSDAADIESKAQIAGVPLVAVLLPSRQQVTLISMNNWPAGYDPYKLDDELRTIITSHGETYIDIMHGFRNIPNAEQHYLPVDGHPDARGHAIISELLARELTDGSVPALKVPASQQAALEQGK